MIYEGESIILTLADWHVRLHRVKAGADGPVSEGGE